jgi:hypothetical protein
MARACVFASTFTGMLSLSAPVVNAAPASTWRDPTRPSGSRAVDPVPNAAPDTSLDRFLERMSDSTSVYFGVAAAKLDTAGLDSALAHGLTHRERPRRAPLRRRFVPDFAFNRVDGPVYSLTTALGYPSGWGRISGSGSYASGPNDVLWSAQYAKGWGAPGRSWQIDLGGGTGTATMDREVRGRRLATISAFLYGRDDHDYLRRAGATIGIHHDVGRWDVGARFRDQVETPIATSAGWDLFHRPLTTYTNLPAWRGRAREAEFSAGVDVPRVPVRLEIVHNPSGHAIGSDFEYRRTRIAASGTFGVSRGATLVPQAVYGRLSGQPVPQAMFYLGSRSLRRLSSDARAGTGLVLGRLELIGTTDVLSALRVPHPAFLPLQLGVFAGTGAVWGTDAFGGPSRPGVDWPRRQEWLSEAGVSLIYQPGIPDPLSLMRLNCAWPVGPDHGPARLSIEFTRALDLTRAPGR